MPYISCEINQKSRPEWSTKSVYLPCNAISEKKGEELSFHSARGEGFQLRMQVSATASRYQRPTERDGESKPRWPWRSCSMKILLFCLFFASFPILPSWLSKFPVIVYTMGANRPRLRLYMKGGGVRESTVFFFNHLLFFFFFFSRWEERRLCVYVSLWDNLLLFLR